MESKLEICLLRNECLIRDEFDETPTPKLTESQQKIYNILLELAIKDENVFKFFTERNTGKSFLFHKIEYDIIRNDFLNNKNIRKYKLNKLNEINRIIK